VIIKGVGKECAVMLDGNRVSFGVKTSQTGVTYDDILRIWKEADQNPVFEHAWLWDHLVPLRRDVRGAALEAWTLLAALAAQTSRLRLGIIVTSNRIRPPAVLAKMAATVDAIARGRPDFGIGVGGSQVQDPGILAGVHREYDAYGVDVVPTGEAVGAFAEACTIFKRMWTEDDPFDFDGRFYQLKGAICEPKPVQRPHPPILIGAGGERTVLRMVAEHANIWNCPTSGSAEEFRHKSRVLDDHCAAIGRDPKEIVRSVQILVSSEDSSAPDAARRLLLELIDAGATHIVLAPIPPYPAVQWLADTIVQPLIDDLSAR
jgi:alkanesulfonate monooxygenase SsuD/methylene tetrahydromethanopterin reductase-like flavin-dependent oxidoreductase (luciferase family)